MTSSCDASRLGKPNAQETSLVARASDLRETGDERMLKRTSETWTQEDAISYECAGEAITHAMAIISAEIGEIEKTMGEGDQITALTSMQATMASERASLHLLDPSALRAVRARYGSLVRTGREGLAGCGR